jgi:hypothetical protein
MVSHFIVVEDENAIFSDFMFGYTSIPQDSLQRMITVDINPVEMSIGEFPKSCRTIGFDRVYYTRFYKDAKKRRYVGRKFEIY